MTPASLNPVWHYLRTAGAAADDGGPADGELLERFAGRGEEAAFCAILRRHGPMVLGVCRRVLRDPHDADDAFQATFLLLVRKAGTLRQPHLLAAWLYGVAYRTAMKSRATSARRRQREGPVGGLPLAAPAEDPAWRDLRPLLDEAVGRLPAKYRVPFVLCCLDGLTHAQAARRLSCPPGTVATRLHRARERLRAGLSRRGVTLSAGAFAAALTTRTSAAVPPALFGGTARLATAFLAGRAAAVPGPVVTLIQGVCRAMLLEKLRTAAVLVGLVGVGAAAWTFQAHADGPVGDPPPVSLPAVAPPVPDEPASVYRTRNFLVEAPSRRVAQLVGDAAERHRADLARHWLGRELPDWPTPCRVRVRLNAGGAGGATSFSINGGEVAGQQMTLEGPLDRILSSNLPHEVTHTVLAHHFKRPVPRWADEGAASLAEDEEDRRKLHGHFRQVLRERRKIRLRNLLQASDYPEDVPAFYAQSHSVTEFLVKQKTPPTFVQFLVKAVDGDLDEAVRTYYGFQSVEALEKVWLASLPREQRPAERPEGVDDSRTPSGPAPTVARARLDEQGRVVVKMPVYYYQPVTSYVRAGEHVEYRPVTTYNRRSTFTFQAHDVGAVRAFTPDGKPLSGARLTALLRQETAVLVSADDKEVDPYHLQVVKDGTPVLILPPTRPTPATVDPSMPPPAVLPPGGR
jgi:RNA polymerase sigma factor (sigma-70 family)